MNNIHRFLEHTALSATLTHHDVEKMIREAHEYNFVGLCLPPFWVKKAKRDLGKADVQMVTVVGFPLGYQMSQTKEAEIQKALKDGADELDVVMNISAFKSGLPWTKIELAKYAGIIHEQEAFLKVIIETAYLSEEEIRIACKLCADAGADFVKTSTGMASEGAKIEDIKLMRACLPSNVGIKASGGIKTYEQAKAFLEAGADRIGTSSAVRIVQYKNEQAP
ncbi:deoxyribose-phosphate aldolase [Catalinimonas niigatensis]|uniref:deoxyribose-phosphate aldolase n=1 Tax=Catalinimonas niigatensis TaxID=1397264 RepID=UPI002666B8AB|nr:deoxyribose-phosphate aldolase [Catalinimonas niigatensis]WPP48141.1 deoxyribose-phosphate aldolase [Catalinimonas niigatensis]